MLRTPLMACAAALMLTAMPVSAQSTTTEADRAAVFQQMLADPSNRDLMRRYAQMSVELRDFEGAAATLERLVDLEPQNTAARVELAIAYFALGSYAVAEYHLAAAQASGALSPDEAARVARYREEAAERDTGSDYSGRIAAGYAWTDTAGESGAFVTGSVDWRLDLGDAHATQWVTEFAFSTFQPGGSSVNERTNVRLRTGPEYRIAQDAYGPRLQPYVELNWFQDDDLLNGDFQSWSLGAQYVNPVNERITVYADAQLGRITSTSTGGTDFDFHEFDLGFTYRPSRETRLRLTGSWSERTEVDDATPDTITSASLRLSGQHAFDPAFQDLPNRWLVGGFVDVAEVESVIGGTTTMFDEQRLAVWMRAFVYEDIYVEGSAAQVMQDATTGGVTTTTDETILTVQVGWEF